MLDLDSAFAYIHDQPCFLSREDAHRYQFIEVSISCDKRRTHDNTFYYSVRTTHAAFLKPGCVFFKSRTCNNDMVSDHERFLTDCAKNGWPWAEFVVYHRGNIEGLPTCFKTVRYPTSAFQQLSGWSSSILRVKKERDPALGWGVVSVKPIKCVGQSLVPFAGPPICGSQYKDAADEDEKFRAYALSYRSSEFEWGLNNYKVGTIARHCFVLHLFRLYETLHCEFQTIQEAYEGLP